MNCSVQTCPIRASFECTCQNSNKLFCKDHLISHLSTSAPPHNNRQIEVAPDPQVASLVISTLEGLSEKIKISIKQLTDDFVHELSEIETRFRFILDTLNEYSKVMNKLILDIKTDPSSISDSRIKVTLFSEVNYAKIELAKWDVFSFSLNNSGLSESIKKWGYVKEDFKYLFTIEQKKVIIKIDGQINKVVSNNLIENKKICDDLTLPNYNFAQRLSLPTANIRQPKKLFCLHNHELKWSTNIPFKYFDLCKSFSILCYLCKKEFSSSCWHCSKCSYDICESCGESKGVYPDKLKCSNNHELLWYPDTPHYYKSINKGRRFKCRSCDLIKSQSNWHCRQCNFDICSVCAKKKGREPLITLLKCENNHDLVIKNLKTSEVNGFTYTPICNYCEEKAVGDGKICETCDYVVCMNCEYYYISNSPGHPLITCHNGDTMRWTQVEGFRCNACFREFEDEHYKCKKCNLNLCSECSDTLMKCVLFREPKSHWENNHLLKWNWSAGSENVTMCSFCMVFYMTGMFCCTACDLKFCLLCYNDPKRLRPHYPTIRFGG